MPSGSLRVMVSVYVKVVLLGAGLTRWYWNERGKFRVWPLPMPPAYVNVALYSKVAVYAGAVSTAGVMDWTPAPAVTVPDGLILTVPVIGPVIAAPALLIWKAVGPVPVLLVPEPVPVELTSVMAEAGPTNAAVALIPDAAAAGAAMAVAITGSDQATPATTLRRLKPFSSPLATFSFKTSDNDAPGVDWAAAALEGRQPALAGVFPASPTLTNVT